MVKTMRRVSKARKPSTPSRRDVARLSMLRGSSSSFLPVNAKSADDGEDDGGDESEDLPTLEVMTQRKTSERGSYLATEASSSTFRGKNQIGEAEKFVDAVHADEGEGANEDNPKQGDMVHGEEGDVCQKLGEGEEFIEAHVDDPNGEEASEDMDGHSSSDIEDSTIAAQDSPANNRPAKVNGKRVSVWDDPKDTERLLELVEQFAMREHYVNPKTGGWRNGAFRDISKQIGIDSKHCNNRFTKLKYKYVEILELLNLGTELAWDSKNNEVIGSSRAWSKVKSPKLKKHKGQKFLYKEEFDNLNGVLKFASPPEVDELGKTNSAVEESSKTGESDAKSSSMAAESPRDDEEGRGEHEASDGCDYDAPSGDKGDPSGDKKTHNALEAGTGFIFSSNTAVAQQSSANRRYSDGNSFDGASMQELVRLLVKYVEEDCYIHPVTKNWQHDVFRKISEKLGKTQNLCSSKYLTLKNKYVNMERLLQMNMGFRLNDEKNEVVGSNGAWGQVKDPNLLRCRRSKFLFWEEFAKLAEKLNFERRPYTARMTRKRTRSSGRIPRVRRLSYVEGSSDEVGEDHDSSNESDSQTDAAHESDEEPLRKKRILSDTYEKRRESFYIATSDMSAKREGLKAIVDAQLAIQREHVAIHNAQIMALRRQLKTESQLSRSLQRCHIKDKQRQDDLEDLRGLAQKKLQHEKFLTPRGKLRIMQTLQGLTNRTDGYLGVMFLELILRKLWCKMELEKEADAQLSDYFIEDENNFCCKEDPGTTHQEVAEESTLLELDSLDESVIAMRGSSESQDINAKESTGEGPDTSGITAISTSNGKHCRDSDSLANGDQVDNGENQRPDHMLDENNNDHELSKKSESEVKNSWNDQLQDIEITPYISTEDNQIGDALKESDQKAEDFQDNEGLNHAFREVESEFVTDLDPDTTVKGPIIEEILNKDAL